MFGLRPHYERMLMDGKDEGGGSSGGGQPTQQEIYDAWQKWNRFPAAARYRCRRSRPRSRHRIAAS